MGVNVLLTIKELVKEYFDNKQFKPSTRYGYELIWKRYLQQRLSGVIVRDFKRADGFKLWKQIHSANPHLSKRTMQHVRFFVSGLFEFAKNVGYYTWPENPASADLPDGLTIGKETQAYSTDEVSRLLAILTSPRDQAIIALAYVGGLRMGELEGVRWEDYERTDTGAVIHIRRSIWHRKLTTPKTISSADDVFIGPEVVTYIEAHRQFCKGVNSGYMFGLSHDRPVNLESLARNTLKPLMDTASIPWKGWHGFRRAAATHLARTMNGKGAEAASLVLRHSGTAVTEAHYIKTSKQENRARQARKEMDVAEQRQDAAAILGQNLKQATIQ